MSFQVRELNIFPLKSAQGQALKEMRITHEGPEGDRQWMIIDEKGQFLTQREVPRLATVQVLYNDQGLNLGLGKQFFVVPKNNSFRRGVHVHVWNEEFDVALEADLFSQALSQYLGISCRLVRYAPFSKRLAPQRLEIPGWTPEVRFADGRPFHLINLKSLEDLNSRLANPVATDRFRANLVYEGVEAYEEDTWKRIRIGDVVFSQPKKCARCVIANMDQKTGEDLGPEPLKTLSTYRKDRNKVAFGTLWIPENHGRIGLQDRIEIFEG